MKYIFIGLITFMLSGCFGEKTFDATNKATIKESAQSIRESLPKEKQENFNKAIMYFSLGGEKGFKSIMAAAFSGNSEITNDSMLATNLQKINGLTGVEIISKHKKSITEQNKIKKLEVEAKALIKDKKFEDALIKYKQIGQHSSGLNIAESGIQETKEEIQRFTDIQNYIDKVKITEFSTQRIDTFSDKNVPAVRISLKNEGKRSLDKVKVIVYFQDKNGKTIYEEDFHPVNTGSFSLTGNNKPLKPEYINEMPKGKFYTIEAPLSEWVTGKATIKIVDIEFSK